MNELFSIEDDNIFKCLDTTIQAHQTPPNFVWLYMRVSYGQEQKVKDILQAEGIEVFHPRTIKMREINGAKKLVECSLIPNTLFVHSTIQEMRKYVGKYPTETLHHFYEPYLDENRKPIGTGRRPIVIPDLQMQSFKIWASSRDENKLFLDTAYFEFKKNDLVRIIAGDFSGFIGHVVRIKGQSRVGILIKNVGFFSTTYVPKTLLQLVTE